MDADKGNYLATQCSVSVAAEVGGLLFARIGLTFECWTYFSSGCDGSLPNCAPVGNSAGMASRSVFAACDSLIILRSERTKGSIVASKDARVHSTK